MHEKSFAQGGSDAAQCDAWRPYLHCLVIDISLQSILYCNIFERLMTQEISRTIYLDAYHVILRNFSLGLAHFRSSFILLDHEI